MVAHGVDWSDFIYGLSVGCILKQNWTRSRKIRSGSPALSRVIPILCFYPFELFWLFQIYVTYGICSF